MKRTFSTRQASSSNTQSKANESSKRERLFSVLLIKEDDDLQKVTVPVHWADLSEKVLYWPAKSKKTIGEHVAAWAVPTKDWVKFEIVRVFLDAGSRFIADQIFQIPTTTEESDSGGNEENDIASLSVTRVESPVFDPENFAGNIEKEATEDDAIPQTPQRNSKKSKKQSSLRIESPVISPVVRRSPRLLQRRRPEVRQPSSSGECSKGSKNSGHYGDGGTSFIEMSNKRFQYVVMMELSQIKERQMQILERLEAHKNQTFVDGGQEMQLVQMKTLDEFKEEEAKLENKNYFQKKVRLVKMIGGKDVHTCVRLGLDSMLTRNLQSNFNKDGQRGKTGVKKTNLYKLILDAFVKLDDPDRTKQKVDFQVGDLLKRAKKDEDEAFVEDD